VQAGTNVQVKASAELSLQGTATAELKSPMTTVNGDGMLTLKGGMVMIN
jgi:type VI secretion system secreted protein VgrG